MTNLAPLIGRNRTFARAGGHRDLSPLPKQLVFVITCIDSRVDPAHVLGAKLGDAIVLRNAGGRVTDDVLRDIAFVSEASAMLAGGDGPAFEVAVLHHSGCGNGLLADPSFAGRFAQQVGVDPDVLAGRAVTDPFESVRKDVDAIRRSPLVPDRVSVSGHVYDIDAGLVSTVIEPNAEVTA